MSSNDGSFSLSTGSLGGEDETEGHSFKVHAIEEPDEAEGHTFKMHATGEPEDPAAEGHAFSRGVVEDDEEDSEGHGRSF